MTTDALILSGERSITRGAMMERVRRAASGFAAHGVGPGDCVALLLESNGVLVAGRDILEAFDRLEVLESTAQALIDARGIGSLVPMSDAALRELDAAFFPGA